MNRRDLIRMLAAAPFVQTERGYSFLWSNPLSVESQLDVAAKQLGLCRTEVGRHPFSTFSVELPNGEEVVYGTSRLAYLVEDLALFRSLREKAEGIPGWLR